MFSIIMSTASERGEGKEKGSAIASASYATMFGVAIASAVALLAVSIYGVYINNKNAETHCRDRLSASQTRTARNINVGGLAIGILLGAIMVLMFVGYHTNVITIGDVRKAQFVAQAAGEEEFVARPVVGGVGGF